MAMLWAQLPPFSANTALTKAAFFSCQHVKFACSANQQPAQLFRFTSVVVKSSKVYVNPGNVIY